MDKFEKEWVSSAVDGALDEQAISMLASDEQSQKQWQRYHIIGDALRGDLPETMPIDLSANIAAALENEPEIVAPVTKATTTQGDAVTSGNVVTLASRVVPMVKQFGQYAIAASVAVFAVIGVQDYQEQSDIDNNPLPVVNTMPLVGSASPVSLQAEPASSTLSQQEYNDKINQQRRRINAYIQDHMLQQRLNTGAQEQDSSELVPQNEQ
ncbi:anti-sigma factor [Shewanella sp. 202IG2-18]|uniref:sigma-E factor negative regulatory protein n=1 Tax=Parashewanella hymeniacidonis TaxID=2807618 RepID=UPI00195F78A5|nr:RseA family anti-sigma factor [Parashewanella hymeniacidonis]MBM7072614.1 anti-sigma factor [Parashewanella hymeniacidonis]